MRWDKVVVKKILLIVRKSLDKVNYLSYYDHVINNDQYEVLP